MNRRWRRRIVGGLGLAILSAGVALQGCAGHLASRIVSGPNTDRVIDPADDPSPAELARLGVDRQFRVDVASPAAASIAAWVLEPSSHARGSVFVLHGHGDSKSTFLDTGKQFRDAGYRAILVDLRAHG